MTKLKVGDLILTTLYTGTRVEICQYEGSTGSLVFTMYDPEIILRQNAERFIRETDSMPYCQRIIRTNERARYSSVLAALHDALQSKKPFYEEDIK